jgi:hypothetical protein
MIINLSGEINSDLLEKLILGINNLKEGEKALLYLNSVGGDVGIYEAMVDIININAHRLELIAYNQICSAAFNLFYEINCPKGMTKSTIGMAHSAYGYIGMKGKNKAVGVADEAFLLSLDKAVERDIKFYKKLGFTALELKSIKEGKDLWFQNERLETFLNKQV